MPSPFEFPLLLVLLMTAVIHLVEALSYSVSFVGLKTRRLATAGTLFGMVLLVSRTANMVQGVLLASIADDTIRNELAVDSFERTLRLVLLAATMGSVCGALLLPTFVRYMTKGIEVFVRYGSYSGLIGALLRRGGFSREDLGRVTKAFSPPKSEQVKVTPFGAIPVWFYVVDILVTAIFTVGVISALYAGVLAPDHRSATGQMSGVVNGIATALLFLVISPRVSNYVDAALADPAKIHSVRTMAVTLVVGKTVGTLASQVFLKPGADLIAALARWL